MNDTRRMTLIGRDPQKQLREWNLSRNAESRCVTVDSFAILRSSMTGRAEIDLDIERVIVDRCASAADFLALLSQIPRSFTGDVLYIRDDETAFLSAAGRGGDRVIYALSVRDLAFYLDAHDLVPDGTPRVAQVLQIPDGVAYAM